MKAILITIAILLFIAIAAFLWLVIAGADDSRKPSDNDKDNIAFYE